MKLSVIIPMFNEENTIKRLILNINSVLIPSRINFEIVVIDDGSTDDSIKIVKSIQLSNLKLILLPKNKGKGNAVRTGILESSGDLILIQDADLEYNPSEIPLLYQTLLASNATSIFGSRILGAKKYQAGFGRYFFYWKNQSIGAWLFNILVCIYFYLVKKIWISDLMTGYKLYKKTIFNGWLPKTNGFETDHEITLRILNTGGKIIEVPIHYIPRSKKDGKKIRFRDGIVAFKTIFNYRNIL
jgi:glycosyltransferase involved in cell wall biosynthesis